MPSSLFCSAAFFARSSASIVASLTPAFTPAAVSSAALESEVEPPPFLICESKLSEYELRSISLVFASLLEFEEVEDLPPIPFPLVSNSSTSAPKKPLDPLVDPVLAAALLFSPP